MKVDKHKLYIWLGICILLMLLVVGWGYTFGHENSIQLTPLLLHAHNHQLYPHDFYVQEAASRVPNERSLYLSLLYPFGENLAWPSFVLFIAATALLLRSLVGIGQYITGSVLLAFSGIVLLLFPFNFHALGMNELFSRELSATLMSDALAAFAIWMILQQKTLASYAAVLLSTCMHPLAGLQAFLLITGSIFVQSMIAGDLRTTWKKYLWPVCIYLATGGVYIVLLQMGMHNETWDDALFFQSFFIFRNAHHYIPTAYSTTDWLMLGPLFLLAPISLFRKQPFLFYFSLLILIGCVIYTFGVLSLQSVTIATAQWFKSTMWLEVIAIFSFLKLLSTILTKISLKQSVFITSGIACIFSISWWFIHFPKYSGWKNNIAYELPFYEKTTPEIDISRQISKTTPVDALFIQPASLDELKYYSRRSGYVDYKALTHTKGFIQEWSERFKEIYQVDPATSDIISFAAVSLADQQFRNLTPATLSQLHITRGITHIVTFADVELPFHIIAMNQSYIVYQLQ